MNAFILSAALTLGQPVGQILPPADAPRYAAKALYKQMELDAIVSRIEKRYLDEDLLLYTGYVGLGIRIATEKRITYRWEF